MRKDDIINNLQIVDITDEGKAVAKYDEMVIFAENAVPGDIADIKITFLKKRYAEGRAINFIKYSEHRTTPFCEHFGVCGGCKWQNLIYEQQLFFKQKNINSCFERIGKFTPEVYLPTMGSEKIQHYRNKLEYSFSVKRWLTDEDMNNQVEDKDMRALGFHAPRHFDKIIDIQNCYLQPEPSNSIRNEVRKFVLENNYDYYDLKLHKGFVRTFFIRNNVKGDYMLIFTFAYNDEEKINALLSHLAEKFSQLTSIVYVINGKRNDTISDMEIIPFKGKEYFYEEIGGLKFKISPKSFFQTNSLQAIHLYNVVKNFADVNSNDVVYDLYTGTGTIANYVAGNAKKVVGIEYIADAIDNAIENSKLNGIENTTFVCGDIAKTFTSDFINLNGKPNVIITDPPRSGMHPKVVEKIIELEPEKIVYVSCNPSTQARDIAMMLEKYKVIKSQAVDMFPHTSHIENVVLLKIK